MATTKDTKLYKFMTNCRLIPLSPLLHTSSLYSLPPSPVPVILHIKPSPFSVQNLDFQAAALMGSGFSSIFTRREVSSAPSPEPSLGDLPESVVASVLEYMNPQEICRLALLNRAFRAAASADFVWESKLPSNYDSIIRRLFKKFPSKLCKRDIYSALCRPHFFDRGTKEAWLDKISGKMCLLISSYGLVITGIDDRRYWTRIVTEESRFHSIAYLQQIWWFEVNGVVEFPLPAGNYSLFFRLQLGRSTKRLGRRVCNSEDVHGWDVKPVQFQLSTSDGQRAATQCYLDEPGNWIHYHAGDFVVENPSAPTKVRFSMTQIDCTHIKGGLCVDSVLIYPSEFKERLKRFLL